MTSRVAPTLLFSSLIILAIPGIIYNNLNASGFTPAFALSCKGPFAPNVPPDFRCTNSNATGCQAVAASCTLSGNNISFLNSCSPFTNILTRNYIGFISSFFTNCGATLRQTAYVNASSLGQLGNAPAENASFSVCTAIANVQAWTCSATVPVIPNWTENSTIACDHWNTIYGSIPHGFANPITGTLMSLCSIHDNSATQNQLTAQCAVGKDNVNSAISLTCNGFVISATTGASSGTTTTGLFGLFGNLATGNILTFFLSLVGGVLLVLLGLGLNVGAATVQAGTNPQGSRFAQAFGVGLLVWSPLYSEFDTWFTSGILPNGLDGTTGVVSVAIIATFFIGLWMFSRGLD